MKPAFEDLLARLQTDYIDIGMIHFVDTEELPSGEKSDDLLSEGYVYDQNLAGIDAQRAELYKLCEEHNVGITVMKGFAGGRLFDEKRSPFGVSLTPIQCIHYALTRPGVASIMCGYDTKEQVDQAVHYKNASDAEKDYATVPATVKDHYMLLEHKASECVGCKACETRCPFSVPIADRMKKAAELFGC